MYYLPLNLRFYLKKTKKHKFKRRTTKISLAIKIFLVDLRNYKPKKNNVKINYMDIS
jgi:hypothetical protein